LARDLAMVESAVVQVDAWRPDGPGAVVLLEERTNAPWVGGGPKP
jgi:hypothetical protein